MGGMATRLSFSVLSAELPAGFLRKIRKIQCKEQTQSLSGIVPTIIIQLPIPLNQSDMMAN